MMAPPDIGRQPARSMVRAKPVELRQGRGFSPDNPYAFQYHTYNNTRPENLGFLEDVRRLMDAYPDVAALGEPAADDALAEPVLASTRVAGSGAMRLVLQH